MPNINQRIEPLGQGGMPRYNRKVNELINTVNWLMGMRSDTGIPISEGGRGPIIPSAPASVGGAQPWLTDPDGNAAGWSSITCLNLQKNQAFDVWIWTGQTAKNVRDIPWMIDTHGNTAHWLVSNTGEVWGTGIYPGAGGGNFQQAQKNYTGSANPDGSPNYHSPAQWNNNPVNPPLSIPTAPPAFYIREPNLPGGNAPALQITSGAGTLFPTDTVNWVWKISYDGTVVLSYSGSDAFTNANQSGYHALDPTGWVFDPTGLPGYSTGSGYWIWKYPGAVSTNTNPTVVENFTFTSDSGYGFVISTTVIYLSA
jgi:hypothetical protein